MLFSKFISSKDIGLQLLYYIPLFFFFSCFRMGLILCDHGRTGWVSDISAKYVRIQSMTYYIGGGGINIERTVFERVMAGRRVHIHIICFLFLRLTYTIVVHLLCPSHSLITYVRAVVVCGVCVMKYTSLYALHSAIFFSSFALIFSCVLF